VNFRLTEEQELVRKNMREFALKHVDPIAAEIDENERHPAEVFRKLAEGGWMGIPIPQEYGGAGSDFLTHIVAVEELCRVCASTGLTMSFQSGILGMLIKVGITEEWTGQVSVINAKQVESPCPNPS